MKKNENQIIKQLSRLNYNEKLLRNDSYLNQFNINPNNMSNDQKIINDKIKIIEKSKANYMMKLEELKNQIYYLQYKQQTELGIINSNKKTKLNKFMEDFNNKESTALIEKKIKKFTEESEKLQLIMKKDLEEKKKKKNDEINDKEKKEEEKRNDLLKKMREEEREFVIKRQKRNTEELLKFKQYMKKKPIQNYLYQKQINDYKKKENNLIKLENIKRKAAMKHIELKEFDEMRKNFDEIKSKKVKESNEKIKIIKESWSQRYKLIPLYANPLSKIVSEEENKMKQEEQNKILRRKQLKRLQENYNVPKPLKIIKERITENKNTKTPKLHLIKSNSYSDILRQRMIEKYKALKIKEEKKKKENNEILDDEDYLLDDHQLSQKILGKRKINDKKYNKTNNKSFENKKKIRKKIKTVDYLKERRRINDLNKKKKRDLGELTNMDYCGTNDIKKLIKDNGINDGMLKVAKSKLESIEEKKRQKNLLLKCSGGVANKPELGEEVCDLMIDSIQAKLSLIKEIDKSLDEKEIKDDNDIEKAHNNIEENSEEENNFEEEY